MTTKLDRAPCYGTRDYRACPHSPTGNGNGDLDVSGPWGKVRIRGQQIVAILAVMILATALAGMVYLTYQTARASADEHVRLRDDVEALIYVLATPEPQRSELLRHIETPRLLRPR